MGLWLGLSVSLLTTTVFVVFLVSRLKWQTEVEKARQRLETNRHDGDDDDTTTALA